MHQLTRHFVVLIAFVIMAPTYQVTFIVVEKKIVKILFKKAQTGNRNVGVKKLFSKNLQNNVV